MLTRGELYALNAYGRAFRRHAVLLASGHVGYRYHHANDEEDDDRDLAYAVGESTDIQQVNVVCGIEHAVERNGHGHDQ